MRRLRLLTLALALLCAAAPAAAQAKTVDLTYSNFFPPTHEQSKLAEAWCREVEKRTHGAVKVAYFPGGALTQAQQIYDGVVEGLSDMGLSVLAYSRGRFPVMEAVDLPLGYPSGAAATAVANAVYARFKPAEFNDVEVMYFHAHGPGLLHTAKKPVRTLEDMKGLKLRATGNSAKVVENLGAAPVAMSMPDSYQAIQKGVVDGGLYPVETNKGWKMAEVAGYCTRTLSVAYTTTFFVVMNKDKWAQIPPEAQQAIRQINAEWSVRHGQVWDAIDKDGMDYFLAKGGKVIELDPAEAQRFKAAAAPLIDDYVKAAAVKGLDGQAIVDFTLKTLEAAQ